jgi:hypothetical protein
MSGSCYWVDHAAPVDQVATVEPATPVIYAVLPGAESATALELTVAMQAFAQQAQHDLEAGISDDSTVGIVGIDLQHTATALA